MIEKSSIAAIGASLLMQPLLVGSALSEEMQAQKVIQDWKSQPQKVAQLMIKKYGEPQEVTKERLVWHNNGPWKRSELINEEIPHDFPLPHKDMLKQVIAYEMPTDKVDDVVAFDGSVIVERTRGELAARCDKEAANFLAVNLANDVATGNRSVAEARKAYGEQIVAMAAGKPAPLTKGLNFSPEEDAGDPGKTTLDAETVERTKQNMKEMMKEKL